MRFLGEAFFSVSVLRFLGEAFFSVSVLVSVLTSVLVLVLAWGPRGMEGALASIFFSNVTAEPRVLT